MQGLNSAGTKPGSIPSPRSYLRLRFNRLQQSLLDWPGQAVPVQGNHLIHLAPASRSSGASLCADPSTRDWPCRIRAGGRAAAFSRQGGQRGSWERTAGSLHTLHFLSARPSQNAHLDGNERCLFNSYCTITGLQDPCPQTQSSHTRSWGKGAEVKQAALTQNGSPFFLPLGSYHKDAEGTGSEHSNVCSFPCRLLWREIPPAEPGNGKEAGEDGVAWKQPWLRQAWEKHRKTQKNSRRWSHRAEPPYHTEETHPAPFLPCVLYSLLTYFLFIDRFGPQSPFCSCWWETTALVRTL